MIKSMTGYGRAQRLVGLRDITAEIKSVNHRYFEFSARIPRAYGYLEEKIKSFVQTSATRGKIDVSLTILLSQGAATEVTLNHSLAQSYLNALTCMSEELGLKNDITVCSLARFPDIFTVTRTPEDEDEVWEAVKPVISEALDSFMSMRSAEGEKMLTDIRGRLETIRSLITCVEDQSPKTVASYRERLYTKINEVLADHSADPQRILTEAAIFAEKTAVDEETVRLRSHIAQFEDILSSGGPAGRKLDFLLQEINREANTIGSKCQDIEIAHTVVELKSEIEKIREQVQNIE